MSDEPISKKTRTEFREFLVGWTLREITDEFEAAGIECDRDFDPGLSGSRRSLVEQYYHSLNFTDPSDVRRLLAAYEGVLNGALQVAEYSDPSDASDRLRRGVRALTQHLERDGFAYRDGRLVAVTPATRRLFPDHSAAGISEVTRRNIMDTFLAGKVMWNGRLSEVDFMRRLFDLGALPLGDGRFGDFAGDIQQHRVRNYDWDDDWIWRHPNVNLLRAPDEVFLRFLCEMIHPVVRPDNEEVQRLLQLFNDNLAADGWEIAECTRLSGKPVFAARRLVAGASQALEAARSAAAALGSDYIHQQITRMEVAVHGDPELAIGTAKEFLETICRTILDARGAKYSREDDPPRLVKLVLKELQLVTDDAPAHGVAINALRRMVSALSGVARGLTELRNLEGTGHGKSAWHECAEPRHARLAVGATTALGVFLFEAYQEGEDAAS